MSATSGPGTVAAILVRIASWFTPESDRGAFRDEWMAELGAHRAWLLERRSRLVGLRVAMQATGALTDALTVGWEAGVGSLITDVRFAVRTLTRSKAFAALAVTTLALGIGATSALYTLVDGVLLRPLPFPEPHELVTVLGVDQREEGPPASRSALTSEADFRDYEERTRTLRSIAGWEDREWILRVGGSMPDWVRGSMVTEGFFDTFGTAPRLGRTFTEAEHRDLSPVVLISDALWRGRFEGDPGVLGTSLEIDGAPQTIVGVLPAGFRFPEGVEIWKPTHARQASITDNASQDGFGRDWRTLNVIGRLAEGTAPEAARSEFRQIATALASEYPSTNTGRTVEVVALHSALVRTARRPLLVLLGAVSLLLLIACLNVGCLLLVRVSGRADELAVRTALGAGRRRMIRQLLTESIVLALVGGIAGMLLGTLALDLLLEAAPVSLPRAETLGLDLRVILGMTLISALSGIAFGLVPALRHSSGASSRTQTASRATSTRGRQRVLNSLAVAQIGLATLLVIGSGLFTRSFRNVLTVDHGYATEGLTTFQLAIDWDRYPGWDRFAEFFERSRERLAAVPGITAVEHVSSPPLSAGWTGWYHVSGQAPVERGERPTTMMRSVTPGYLPLAGIELVAGRWFSVGDDQNAPGVAIVNQTFAERVFGGVDAALGESLEKPQFWGSDYPDAHRIVGVVSDTRAAGLDEQSPTMLFLPFEQAPMGNNMMLVRTDRELAELVPDLRAAMVDVDPLLPLREVQTQNQRFATSVADRRFAMQLSTAFGLVAYLLSAIGLYGVIAFGVAERRRELGLKRALGARDRVLVREVLGRSLGLGAIGVGVGVAGALAAGRLVRASLYGVPSLDHATYLVAGTVVLLATLAAGWVPMRRAMSVEPRQVMDG